MKLFFFYKYRLLTLFLLPLSVYCKKSENSITSLNLTLLAEVRDDGTGLVNFTAKADHADRYYFDFGINTESFRSTNGMASVTYPYSGTFTVKVTAYGAGNSSAIVSKDINVTVSQSDEGYSTPESYPGMNLVWRDEFNGTALKSDWTFDIGNGQDGWGNEELQYYRKENTTVNDGLLTITARKETFQGFQYTSSKIKTQPSQTFKYGRIDIRAKLPKGQGIWPALWMLGANIETDGWPYSGEIDIMELVGGGVGKDNTVHGTLHFDDNGTYASYSKSYSLPSGNFSDKFHVFSILWDETSIKWFVDDIEFHSQDISSPTMNEFHEKFYLILNVAVGGRWPGSPDSSTSYPQKMLVDYVRVFEE